MATTHVPPSSKSAGHIDARYTQDVRFAVVLYGGVSLAIYINGVVQELLHMVRASAADRDGHALLSKAQLTGTERVYRTLAQLLSRGTTPDEPPPGVDGPISVEDDAPLQTRFVVDVLSGTSAGGINAVFLAKALANEQPLESLKELWVEEGDIGRLLNDAASVRSLAGLVRQVPPRSLLNGERMYVELLRALRGMDDAAPAPPGREGSRLVEEMDLFVTTTDVRGAVVPLRLADRVVYERRFRRAFHFAMRGPAAGEPTSDFGAGENALLAFAARCTSAFPFAFEPMEAAVARTLQHRFPPRGARERDVDSAALAELFREPPPMQAIDPTGGAEPELGARAYVDGGYLDNKPFSYAVDALTSRHAVRPVERKLLYVEPAPEHPERESEPVGPPDALENVQAALLGVPRYESIREDLQRLLARNRLLERAETIYGGALTDLVRTAESPRLNYPAETFREMDLADMVRVFGVSYGAYQRLKVADVSDSMARALTRAAGLDPESDQMLAARYLVRAWRDRGYDYYRRPGAATFNAFVLSYDLEYRLRRLSYTRARLNDLSLLDERLLGRANVPVPAGDQVDEFRQALVRIQRGLDRAVRILAAEQDLLAGDAGLTRGARPDPAALLAPRLHDAGFGPTLLAWILAGPSEEERRQCACWILGLGDRPAFLDALGADEGGPVPMVAPRAIPHLVASLTRLLRLRVRRATVPAAWLCDRAFRREEERASAKPGAGLAALAVRHVYENFEVTDLVTYPALYGTEVGDERGRVDVLRISPEDAVLLIPPTRAAGKLAGTALGHFGAFFDAAWRRNDILWGRLDGAERLIDAVVPASRPRLRRQLTREAHLAILAEEFRATDREAFAQLLVKWALRQPGATRFFPAFGLSPAGKRATIAATDRATMSDADLYDYFKNAYQLDRDLDPRATLSVIARAATITGDLLSGVAEEHGNVGKPLVRSLARVGRTLTVMVAFATPGTLPNAGGAAVLALAYLLELLMLGGAILLNDTTVRSLALKLLLVTLAAHVGVTALEGYIRWPHALRTVGRWLVYLVVAAVVVLTGIGAYSIWHADLKTLLGQSYGQLNLMLAVTAIVAFIPGLVASLDWMYGIVRRQVLGLVGWWRKRSPRLDRGDQRPQGAPQRIQRWLRRRQNAPAFHP